MDDELKNVIVLRMDRFIEIMTDAKKKFSESTESEESYNTLHASVCNACAHMDHVLASVHAYTHRKQITEKLEKEKKEKKGKRFKKHDKRKRKD
jgi:hypothetical protein